MKNYTYDLEERTNVFAELIIDLCRNLPKDIVATALIRQIIRSGTSIGANYCEANGASSKKDFKNKIFICKKEAKETMYWLRLIQRACPEYKENCQKLWKESYELAMIFAKIAFNTKITD